LGTWFRETLLHAQQRKRCDAGYGVGPTGLAVYLDFKEAIERLGKDVVEQKYGNLFQMYEKIVDENPYETPMMIYPAIHYHDGRNWVDYELMTSLSGLFAIGEANSPIMAQIDLEHRL
jgi:succinate dehydrogenase / fumarate reductase flavoprotein subunit